MISMKTNTWDGEHGFFTTVGVSAHHLAFTQLGLRRRVRGRFEAERGLCTLGRDAEGLPGITFAPEAEEGTAECDYALWMEIARFIDDVSPDNGEIGVFSLPLAPHLRRIRGLLHRGTILSFNSVSWEERRPIPGIAERVVTKIRSAPVPADFGRSVSRSHYGTAPELFACALAYYVAAPTTMRAASPHVADSVAWVLSAECRIESKE